MMDYRILRSAVLLLTAAIQSLDGSSISSEIGGISRGGSTPSSYCIQQHSRDFDMYVASCAGRKLDKLPASLKSYTEVLDATDNKIRELNADTFASLTSLRYLYLGDNAIYIIHKSTFDPLQSLEALDLSKNSLQTIPSTIFNLPSLVILILNGNSLTSLPSLVANLEKPIKAPLTTLNLEDCRLEAVPEFGLLPNLKNYSLSNNPLTSFKIDHFTGACSLVALNLSSSIQHIEPCSLKNTFSWLSDHGVAVGWGNDDLEYLGSKEFDTCPTDATSDHYETSYKQCQTIPIYKQPKKVKLDNWIVIGGGLFLFMFGFIFLLYILHLINVRHLNRINKKKEKAKHLDANIEGIASSKLLNDTT